MKFKYPSLLPGYLGLRRSSLTLNSRFFELLWHEPARWHQRLVFPQRVPRIGFFWELNSLEGKAAAQQFSHKIRELKLRLSRESNPIALLNLLRALTRYGELDAVVRFSNRELPAELLLDFKTIKIIAETSLALSQGKQPSFRLWLRLFDEVAVNNAPSEDRLAAQTAFLASAFRYRAQESVSAKAREMVGALKTELRRKPRNFSETILHSMALRGMAMDESVSLRNRSLWLDKALRLATEASALCEIEKVVQQENLFTLHQTLAKWSVRLGRVEAAEEHLFAMTKIDPLDSTAFSELGLHNFNEKNYAVAAKHFSKATKLGPPGVGMNSYFLGTCLRLLGKGAAARQAFQRATEWDDEGVSAWLALYDMALEAQRMTEARKTSRWLQQQPNLWNQLSAPERKLLRELKPLPE